MLLPSRHSNGAVIARCSQPEVGWLGWRSSEDEDLVKAISEACAYDSPISSSNGMSTTAAQLLPPSDSDKEAVTPSSDIPSLCDLPEAKAQADIKVCVFQPLLSIFFKWWLFDVRAMVVYSPWSVI